MSLFLAIHGASKRFIVLYCYSALISSNISRCRMLSNVVSQLLPLCDEVSRRLWHAGCYHSERLADDTIAYRSKWRSGLVCSMPLRNTPRVTQRAPARQCRHWPLGGARTTLERVTQCVVWPLNCKLYNIDEQKFLLILTVCRLTQQSNLECHRSWGLRQRNDIKT